MIFRQRDVSLYAAMQSSKGSAATISAADFVDDQKDSPLIRPMGELIDRGLRRAERWPSQKIVSGQWGEGGVNQEIFGSGTPGTVKGGLSPFLETLLGAKLTNSAGTVNDASATDTEFDSDLDLTVGQLVRVDLAGDESVVEIRRIASKSGGGPTYTYTVQRAFSQAPIDTAPIAAGVTYYSPATEVENYMTIHQYTKTIREVFTDAVASAMEFGVTERQTIKGNFTVKALQYAKTLATADPFSPTYDNTNQPHVGTSCNLVVDGTAKNMREFNFNLTTRRERGGINTTGIGDLPWADMFEASGTITPWVEDFSEYDAFFAETLAAIEMTNTQGNNILHVELADIQYTGPEIGEDEGDFQWSLPFDITGGVFIGMF